MSGKSDWIAEARSLFLAEKPEHFTNYEHCDECQEHDQTLLAGQIDTIGLEELGNPGWDPICFSSAEGVKYYMPALIRLSLESVADAFYLEQLLFHLEFDGANNKLYLVCDSAQREFMVRFLDHMILNYAGELEKNCCADDALRVRELWSGG